VFEAQLIFPLNGWHNHASSLVECPNGDLLACWFSGSGERTADDVQILGARASRR
jgi:predicted neuraminidase